MITLDIETRARLSVVDAGLYRHAPTAKILGMRYRLEPGADLMEWRGYFADGVNADCSDDPPDDLLEAVRAGTLIMAHNAAYERVVLSHQPWWPKAPVEQYVCSAAWAASFNMPRSLKDLSGRLLGAEQGKLVDVAGKVSYMWHEKNPLQSAADMDLQMEYCGRDVEAMEACMAFFPAIDPRWLAEYHANEHVNDLGVFIDEDLARAVIALKPQIDADVLTTLQAMTDDTVKVRGPSLLKWLQANLPEDVVGALTVNRKIRVGYGFRTKKTISADKVARRQVLEAIEDRDDMGNVRQALLAFEEANKAATSKFGAAIARLSEDGALRGQFVFAGAGQTGRFSSTGVQVHNLKRDVAENAGEVIAALVRHQLMPSAIIFKLKMTVSQAASEVLRPLFVAGLGAKLVWGDWLSVEARMLPWLSGDKRAQRVLQIFRDKQDVYLHEATNIFGVPVTEKKDPRRQVGKVAVLSLGYQGGVGAFQSMSAGYNVKVSDAEAARIRDAWRAANPWAPVFWAKLEDAAMRAITHPGDLIPCGEVVYQFVPALLGGTLLCWLPSGHWIAYPEAKIVDVEKFDELRPSVVFMHPTYGPSATYGGALAENITQAACAVMMREALVRCQAAGLKVVLHVHDEIVIETEQPEVDGPKLKSIMEVVPAWAEGLPVEAEIQSGDRYKIPG